MDYLRGCFANVLDLSILRTIRLGGNRSLQFRVEIFIALNQSLITGRNTSMGLASALDGTQTNLPFDASGSLIVARSLPKNAGFGVATGYQAPRTVQAQIRVSF